MNFIKSILHNIGVLIVGFIFAFIGVGLDLFFKISEFRSLPALIIGCVFLAIGFLTRVWATFYFYKQHMSVIRLEPQKELFKEPTLSWWQRIYFPRGSSFAWIAEWNCFDRARYYCHKLYDPARRKAIGAGFWATVDRL